MAKLKTGKFSDEEIILINSAYSHGTSIDVIAKALNRSQKSIQKYVGESKKDESIPLVPLAKDPSTIPDPPHELTPGYARKHFEIPDSKKPGQKRKGIAIMTEGGSEAGDTFLKAEKDGLLPMSSKYKNFIVKAQND